RSPGGVPSSSGSSGASTGSSGSTSGSSSGGAAGCTSSSYVVDTTKCVPQIVLEEFQNGVLCFWNVELPCVGDAGAADAGDAGNACALCDLLADGGVPGGCYTQPT